jgi:inner membrane protein YidH
MAGRYPVRAIGGHILGAMTGPATAADATRRTRLANERTFLAWWRTALGVEGLALATGKLVPEVTEGTEWPYIALGTLLALLGAALALTGWWRHATVEHGLSGGEEAAPPEWLMSVMGAVLGVAGLMLAVLLLAV